VEKFDPVRGGGSWAAPGDHDTSHVETNVTERY
jgi:hypothetical protein